MSSVMSMGKMEKQISIIRGMIGTASPQHLVRVLE